MKRIGTALFEYGTDHRERLPWVNAIDGTYSHSYAYESWLTLTNYLVSPEVFVCPGDTAKIPSEQWFPSAGVTNSFLAQKDDAASYAVGSEAYFNTPECVQVMDRNYQATYEGIQDCGASGFTDYSFSAIFPPTAGLGWKGMNIHRGNGNVGLVDGSVLWTSRPDLVRLVEYSGGTDNSGLHVLKPFDSQKLKTRTGEN